MIADRPCILIAGQFPAPATGFTYITQAMTNFLARDYQTVAIDLSLHRKRDGVFYHFQRLMLMLRGLMPIIRHARKKGRIFYTACEGGIGLVYTIKLCGTARLLGYKIYIHHHSFSYINAPKSLMKILLIVTGTSTTHIFLCQSMANAFITRYAKTIKYKIVSNGVFVAAQPLLSVKAFGQNLVIGLLGNLNNAKGLGHFLNLLKTAAERGLNITGILAGPVDSDADRIAIEQAQKILGNRLDYRGALYDEAKAQFYRDIDVFVFPTLYTNEAQPLVIFEALSHGVPVLSYDRGSIAAQIGSCGAVLERGGDFTTFALSWLQPYMADPETLILLKQEARAAFIQNHEASKQLISQLFTTDTPLHVDIWHNILWSQYKGEVFSSIHKLADKAKFNFHFLQISESDSNRVSLSDIDLSRHRYPFDLLFKSSYDKIGLWARLTTIVMRTIKSDADLVLLTGYEKPECWVQLFTLKLKGKKVAVFCDSTINDKKQNLLRGALKTIFFKSVDGIFCYGQRSRDYVLHYGAAHHKVHIRCQAAALPQNHTIEKALAARVVIHRDAPRFLYVGRLSPEKGLDTLIGAFAVVHKHYPKSQLILVGDGSMRDILRSHAQEIGIATSVIFTGGKSGDDLFHEYTQATCLILPSISEPWGLVVNEALAYGCPVIVSDKCGCVPELVIEGKTGFVHKTGDTQDLAAKMLAAVIQFSDAKTTADECIKLISHYTPDKAAAQIIVGCRAIMGKEAYARL